MNVKCNSDELVYQLPAKTRLVLAVHLPSLFSLPSCLVFFLVPRSSLPAFFDSTVLLSINES